MTGPRNHRRLLHSMTALIVGVSFLAGVFVAAASPAGAVDGKCEDWVIAQQATVYVMPNNQSAIVKYKNLNDRVTGTCNYFNHNDPDGAHWYMEVYLSGGGYGYIWVQRLDYGQHHECADAGYIRAIPSSYCPVYNT